ncbi:MAG TPA: nuclear transport factor 2 family protein [Blastocatellia bacterium]|nr:nuclear transport factor 2 family protein [Blastocatellia bacterium]
MNDEEQVTYLERQWINAFVRSDVEALRNILADDFVFTDPYGSIRTKEEWLAELSSGDLKIESLDIDDLRVKITGNVATADVFLTIKAKSTEGGYNGQYHTVDVYEKREGRWQAVVSGAKPATASPR